MSMIIIKVRTKTGVHSQDENRDVTKSKHSATMGTRRTEMRTGAEESSKPMTETQRQKQEHHRHKEQEMQREEAVMEPERRAAWEGGK